MRNMYKCSLGKLFTAAMLLILGLGDSLQPMNAQSDLLSNSLVGREFWLAIPPMIGDPADVNPEDLFLMVTPTRATRVRVEVDGLVQERDVEALTTTIFSLANSGLRQIWQVNESETVLPLGIHVSASEPMVVSMYNGRNRAGEAYQAIPANKLGYNYRHMGYYDRNFGNQQERGGGFIIVATRNGTDVKIELDGIGEGQTEGGRDFIDPEIEISMNRGDVYMVRGEGEAVQGSYDITGTKIESSDPIAVIAFHQQINVPAAAATAATGGLSEMLPPINTWGQTYVAFAWQESSAAQVTHYRVISDENFNEILVRSYNESNDQLIEQKTANLIDAGDFRAFEDIDPWANPGAYLRDITVWTTQTNKPFMLMQYSGGQVWAEARPHMTVIPATEQMVNSTTFITPPDAILAKRIRVHLIAESVPDQPEISPFTQIRIDGQTLTDAQPTLFATQVPGGEFWWASFTLEPGGVHQMDGERKFNGIITGQFQWGSFSHPIAIGFNDLDGFDEVPPTISFEPECSSVVVTAREETVGEPDPRQEDEGIADVGIIASESSNARLEYISPASVLGQEGVSSFVFRIRPIDPTKPVVARVQVLDRAGNSTFQTFEIEASSEFLELRRRRDNFGDVRVGVVQEKMIQIENPTNEALEITSIELLRTVSTPFEIIELPELPLTIESGGSQEVGVRYIPRREDIGDRPDSVIVQVTTECNVFEVGRLFGSGVKSEITVTEEWNAGEAPVNSEACNQTAGIRVRNEGTATLTVTRFEIDSEHFTIDNLSETLPATIAPNGGVSFTGMCFTPKEEGELSVVVRIFVDDGGGEQPYASRWFGTGTPAVVDIVTDPNLPGFVLYDAAPNPVNSSVNNSVQLRYALGRAVQTRLNVYDALGNHVMTLMDQFQSSGDHSVNVNTSNLAPGVYSYRLEAGQFVASEQFVVVR